MVVVVLVVDVVGTVGLDPLLVLVVVNSILVYLAVRLGGILQVLSISSPAYQCCCFQSPVH